MSDREGVAVRIPEVGDLGAPLARGDTPPIRDDRPFVVTLEGDASGGPVLQEKSKVKMKASDNRWGFVQQPV